MENVLRVTKSSSHCLLRHFVLSITACAALAACGGGGGGGGVSIAGGQGADPATVDFPVFYVKRPVPDPMAAQTDLRVLRTFQVGADLYMRDRASPTATETNLTSAILNGLGDVRDVDVSFDGTRVAFALRGPRI